MTASILNDVLFADLLGGIVNAERAESGEIIGYSLSTFGEQCLEFDEAAGLYGEGVV